ncbi:MAG: lysine--tRNA ligase [Spirochaeta sp. LUC14_002_19_P3]|nr:MAG: lysine--tRNA ligase [Spirochaeta sp. LUC14_002_19_P3]
MNDKPLSSHWADISADTIIRERGEKEHYVCASGITPSGTVHIGNFREIISVELVVRALRDRGRKVRFIYSWDDYDVFRKVPANMPRQEYLAQYLRQPITCVPDVLGREESYAARNEKNLEAILPKVGIEPEYIYQASRYRASHYAEEMKTALDKKDTIRQLLNAHRTAPLPEDWQPLSVFCTQCHRDTTEVKNRDGEYGIRYECSSCGNTETVDLRSTGAVKLPWRIDWPMRWHHEKVDFEPAGKDHHTEGGSFDTARTIAGEVYKCEAPVTFQYEFVRVKGGSGKLSSSSGEVVSLSDVLRYYQPEVVRYLFAGTRPNTDFAISFDLDIFKIYEDYDKLERSYFNKPDNPKKLNKWQKDARTYELSQISHIPQTQPAQIQIRHLTVLLQIHSGNIGKALEHINPLAPRDILKLTKRAECAWNWVCDFAPEEFRFSLRSPETPPIPLAPELAAAVLQLRHLSEQQLGKIPEKDFSKLMYQIIQTNQLESAEFFRAVYQLLIAKDEGPRLINFLHILGTETVLPLLSPA